MKFNKSGIKSIVEVTPGKLRCICGYETEPENRLKPSHLGFGKEVIPCLKCGAVNFSEINHRSLFLKRSKNVD